MRTIKAVQRGPGSQVGVASAKQQASVSGCRMQPEPESQQPESQQPESQQPELPQPEPQPPYCCVVLGEPEARAGCDSACASASGSSSRRIFVEQRGADAAVAASRLTCWGGKREPLEEPLRCVVRECLEEMGWAPQPDSLRRACVLYVDSQLVAWFYAAAAPTEAEVASLRFEAGRSGVWVDGDDPRISPWHATVLAALADGRDRADHTSPDAEEAAGTVALLDKLARKHAAAAAAAVAAAAVQSDG
jgi:8-oxo-dGTP pyrophosphatase MutT (NUDIX family)